MTLKLKKQIFQTNMEKILRFFQILTQFSFTASERKLDYYHQIVKIWVASRVAKRLRTWDPRKKIYRNPWNASNWWKSNQLTTFKAHFNSCAPKLIKITRKYSIRKPMFFSFVDLSTIFCPGLSEEIYISNTAETTMEFTFLIYFSISKDSFTLQTHV